MQRKNKIEFLGKLQVFLKRNKLIVLAIFFLGILGDIFFLNSSSDFRYFGFLGIGILGIFFYNLSGKFFFSFALFVLLIMFYFFVTSGPSTITEKAAVWFFL